MNARTTSHADNCARAWQGGAPVWVVMLAEACDAESLARVGRRISYSTATISQAINNKYSGDMLALGRVVEGALQGKMIACPIMGLVNIAACIAAQKQPFGTISPQKVRLSRTCPACPDRQGENHD